MSLTEFLLARIAEDEATYGARAAEISDRWHRHILTECEAKRRIVENSAALFHLPPKSPLRSHAAWVGSVLALPYADHPDYDEAWRA